MIFPQPGSIEHEHEIVALLVMAGVTPNLPYEDFVAARKVGTLELCRAIFEGLTDGYEARYQAERGE